MSQAANNQINTRPAGTAADLFRADHSGTPHARHTSAGGKARKTRIAAGGAAILIAAAAIAFSAGAQAVPSLIIAAGAVYLAYMAHLAVSYRNLITLEMADAIERQRQSADNWLGSGVGRIKPGSDDAAMHLALGTLPQARIASNAGERNAATRH